MSNVTRATSPEVPEPQAGTWSNCLVAGGFAYIAGMTARGSEAAGDEYIQAKAIFSKIRHLVEAAGGAMADVMKVTIFVTDIGRREKVWQARREFFTGNFCASTLVQVAALATPALKVEINAVAPIDAGQALRNSLDLARHVEALGYRRYWMAEHHNLPGIASAATAVALAHIAAGTSRITLGAGGIMLPNHAPLMVAEQFGTLAALHPGRIELGLGRAPGSDQLTMRAMRRNLLADVDQFPQDVVELMSYFRPAEPGQRMQAVPGAGLDVPIWILGSSLFGAQLAAILGLPFAFASHFAPGALMQALAIYRERFQPSEQLAAPHVMLGVTAVAADTDEEA